MAAETQTADHDLVDGAILGVLPEGEKVLSVERCGTSTWALTARMIVRSPDGSERSYFLKILSSSDAPLRVRGEYLAMREIYQTLPTFAPRPVGYGLCSDEEASFFICDYVPLENKLPDPVRLGQQLAELHKKSQSPTGMFGFYCTTFDGRLPLNTTWESSWTVFFQKLMLGVYQLDVETNGHWKELDEAMQVTIDELIPRLLDVLTSEDRSIKPCLIHGDLWEGNIGTNANTGEISIFDACSYYAHHEKEVGIWRCEHHEMTNPEYRKEYFKNMRRSEPVEEYEDRNRLYAVETRLINSAHFPGEPTRQLALNDLRFLISMYLPESLPVD
ncbi:uncharacterized protein E0L32_004937 [Thyridium curvatum]|uniref:protein-ribulosamine 3-kinase n=1 Tax=Thyridium curvatum TaxID=1093900 RepID=A0A507BDJ3_9PEZI|nr:uncharacterized protein E0L32_004937 [Thyridium curvatum]TPX14828.1 hypothetical protein E0L32_004937 [Thyridium curvatum]